VIVIELTPTRGGEREGAKSKIGLCSGISMVQVTGESNVLSTYGVSIYECVNTLYVDRKVVIVIELTPTRGGEREGAKSKIGLCSGISMVQVTR
jgi:hypothetical protein